jgi:hypothetical protein
MNKKHLRPKTVWAFKRFQCIVVNEIHKELHPEYENLFLNIKQKKPHENTLTSNTVLMHVLVLS